MGCCQSTRGSEDDDDTTTTSPSNVVVGLDGLRDITISNVVEGTKNAVRRAGLKVGEAMHGAKSVDNDPSADQATAQIADPIRRMRFLGYERRRPIVLFNSMAGAALECHESRSRPEWVGEQIFLNVKLLAECSAQKVASATTAAAARVAERVREGSGHRYDALLQQLDADGDGEVSAEEVVAFVNSVEELRSTPAVQAALASAEGKSGAAFYAALRPVLDDVQAVLLRLRADHQQHDVTSEQRVARNTFVRHMQLVDGWQDPVGVRVRPKEGRAGLDAVEYLSTVPLVRDFAALLGPLVESLYEMGYEPGSDLLACTYDWRCAPSRLEQRDAYFSRVMADIEQLVRQNGGERCAVVCHSMGCRTAHYFFHWVERSEWGRASGGRAWLDAHVHSFVPIGGPFLGACSGIDEYLLTGDCQGLAPSVLSHSDGNIVVRSWGSFPFLFGQPQCLALQPAAAYVWSRDEGVLKVHVLSARFDDADNRRHTTLQFALRGRGAPRADSWLATSVRSGDRPVYDELLQFTWDDAPASLEGKQLAIRVVRRSALGVSLGEVAQLSLPLGSLAATVSPVVAATAAAPTAAPAAVAAAPAPPPVQPGQVGGPKRTPVSERSRTPLSSVTTAPRPAASSSTGGDPSAPAWSRLPPDVFVDCCAVLEGAKGLKISLDLRLKFVPHSRATLPDDFSQAEVNAGVFSPRNDPAEAAAAAAAAAATDPAPAAAPAANTPATATASTVAASTNTAGLDAVAPTSERKRGALQRSLGGIDGTEWLPSRDGVGGKRRASVGAGGGGYTPRSVREMMVLSGMRHEFDCWMANYARDDLFRLCATEAPPVRRVLAIFGVNVRTKAGVVYRRKQMRYDDDKAQSDWKHDKHCAVHHPGYECEGGVVYETPNTPQADDPTLPAEQRTFSRRCCGDRTVPYWSLRWPVTWRSAQCAVAEVQVERGDHRGILKMRECREAVLRHVCDPPRCFFELRVTGLECTDKHAPAERGVPTAAFMLGLVLTCRGFRLTTEEVTCRVVAGVQPAPWRRSRFVVGVTGGDLDNGGVAPLMSCELVTASKIRVGGCELSTAALCGLTAGASSEAPPEPGSATRPLRLAFPEGWCVHLAVTPISCPLGDDPMGPSTLDPYRPVSNKRNLGPATNTTAEEEDEDEGLVRTMVARACAAAGEAQAEAEAADSEATAFDHIIVVTDPAEEVDDETAIFYLESWAEGLGARRPVISYVFVEGLEASEVRKAHVVEMMPRFFGGAKTADPNRKSFLLDKTDAYAPPTPPPKNVLLMQVGPVNEGAEGETTRANVDALLGAAAASGEYTYALQGKLGGTFNSAKKAQPIAAAWAARAKRGTLSLVAAPPALPKYSYNAALRFDDDAARLGVLGSEILRVGFKNTLGRAPPVLPNGFDLTHLVQGTEAETGKGRGGYGAGANYLATQQIYNGIKGSDGAWAKLVEDGRWKGEEYMAMARAYFADKGVDPPAAEGADAPPSGSGGDGKGGHTTGTLHGLAQMCLAFDELFGLRTVLSSGAAEFKLSVEQLAASSLGSVWTEFLERMAAAPDTLLTPAYDLTLAYAVANPTLPHFTALDPADNKTVTASKVSLVSMMNDGGPAPFTLEPIVREMGVHGIMASCGTPALPIASAPPAPVVPAPRSPVRVSIGEVPEV